MYEVSFHWLEEEEGVLEFIRVCSSVERVERRPVEALCSDESKPVKPRKSVSKVSEGGEV